MKKNILITLLSCLSLVSCGVSEVSANVSEAVSEQISEESTSSIISEASESVSEEQISISEEVSSLEESSPEKTEPLHKYISFLGDSISTYSGYSNSALYNSTLPANAIWFPNNNYTGANMPVTDTWWMKTCSFLDFTLCVDNSFSGACVFDSYTYNTRAKNLHNDIDNINPDIVVIYMGINDWAAQKVLGTYDGTTTAPLNPTSFTEAYGRTIDTILETYPDVDLYCCTFTPDCKRSVKETYTQVQYVNAIKTIATNKNINLIDLYNDTGITTKNITQYTVDTLHPNQEGMKLISMFVADAIAENYGLND